MVQKINDVGMNEGVFAECNFQGIIFRAGVWTLEEFLQMMGKEEIEGKDSIKKYNLLGDIEGSWLTWKADVFWRRFGTLTRKKMWKTMAARWRS